MNQKIGSGTKSIRFILAFLLILTGLFISGCGENTTTNNLFSGYATNAGRSIAELNYSHTPLFDVNALGELAWVQKSADKYMIYLYGAETSGTISDEMEYPGAVRINTGGNVVWQAGDGTDQEIYLYERNRLFQITDNSAEDTAPWLNDDGSIVWSSAEGYTSRIFRFSEGTTTALSDGPQDLYPQINKLEQVIWQGNSNMYLYSGTLISQISEDPVDLSVDDNSACRINARGQAVWTGIYGDHYHVYLYSGEKVTRISEGHDTGDNLNPRINDGGWVVWEGHDGNDSEIYLYKEGTVSQITNNGVADSSPSLNNSGQIAWASGNATSEIYVLSDDEVYRLTSNSVDDVFPRINDQGQVFWVTREFEQGQWTYEHIFYEGPCEFYGPVVYTDF